MSMDTPVLLIAWPCLGVSSAITWFFEQVDEGILYVRQTTLHRQGFRITMGCRISLLSPQVPSRGLQAGA